MAIEQTILGYEIDQVLRSPFTYNSRTWQAFIHLMDANLTIIPIRVTYVNTSRDYFNNYADEVTMECVIPVGTYSDVFYPNKLNLEVTLVAHPRNPLKGGAPKSFRYKATVLDAGQPRLNDPDMNGGGTNDLDLTDVIKLTFQLIPKTIYELRTAAVGVIFRKSKPEDAMKTLLTTEVAKIKGDAAEVINGIDMVKADNQEEQEQMVVPHGTMLYDIPEYFQKMICGIYNTGISHFLQWNNWFIYPSFDIDRFNQTDRLLTLVILPEKKFPQIEKTYRKTGKNSYTVLGTAAGSYKNPVKEQVMNEGTGLRFMNAETILSHDETAPSQNKVKVQRDKIVSQITELTPKDGVTFAPVSNTPITANNFEEKSKIAGRTGSYLSFKWENSYPEAIIPGMMIRVLYLTVDNQVNELKGVILKAEHHEHLTKESLVEEIYTTNTAIFAYCENDLVLGTQKSPIRTPDVIANSGKPLF